MSVVALSRVVPVTVVLVFGLAAGCTGSPSKSSTGGGVAGSVDVAKDVAMESNLRTIANCEEAYYTDANAYGTLAQVKAKCPVPQLPSGEVVILHLAVAPGYCLAGQVGTHRYWIYDSTKGGVSGPATSDTCDTDLFGVAGGTVGH